MQQQTEQLLASVLQRLESMLPVPPEKFDWTPAAYRWVKKRVLGTDLGTLQPVREVAHVDLESLLHIDRQKTLLVRNTEAFVKGLPANNVLLTGARGTGKSSLIRGCLARFYNDGLRLIEVDKADLKDLSSIVDAIAGRPEKFIVFCDDLSFELAEGGYKALKAALDGSVAAGGDNLLVYATSNRRHLMPEPASDNLSSTLDENGDLHPGEVLEEKLSLAERFGLWLSFYPFTQNEYLAVVSEALRALCCAQAFCGDALSEDIRLEALQFAIERGGRSGRVGMQFAKLIAARFALEAGKAQ